MSELNIGRYIVERHARAQVSRFMNVRHPFGCGCWFCRADAAAESKRMVDEALRRAATPNTEEERR